MRTRCCAFCRQPLERSMRKDAMFCSTNCRVRASYWRRKQPGYLEQPRSGPPPITSPSTDPPRLAQARPLPQHQPAPVPTVSSKRPAPASKAPTAASTERAADVPAGLRVGADPIAVLEVAIRPHAFAERHPLLWLERAIAGPAPPEAVAYFLLLRTGLDRPLSSPSACFRLVPFELPTVPCGGIYTVEYVTKDGDIAPTTCRVSLRIESREAGGP